MIKRGSATQERQPAQGDAAWLQTLLRRAEASVSSDKAPAQCEDERAARPTKAEAADRPKASAKLRARAEGIARHAQSRHPEVCPVAVTTLFDGWRLYDQGTEHDYVFCHLPDDPLFEDPDRFPIPENVLADLRRLDASGLGDAFDTLYVVHEVEKGTVHDGEALDADKLVPPSPHVQRRSERMGRWGRGLWLGAATPLLTGIGAAAVSPALLAAAPLGLDPLLLGAVVEPGRPIREGEIAVWFHLAHWRYADDA